MSIEGPEEASRKVTLESVRNLDSGISESIKNKNIAWKDFGAYLDKKVDWHLDEKFIENLSSSPSVIFNVLSDQSYLSQVVKYCICNSCHRPIGQDSLDSHHARCVEMKHKKSADPDSATLATNNSAATSATNKRKRGRAALVADNDNSSVDSTRVGSPNPSTPGGSQGPSLNHGLNQSQSQSQLGASGQRPKKKYKKSQMQKEKEAANAAAAAAAAVEAAAQRANNQVKKKKSVKSKPTNKAKGPVDVEKQCGVPLPLGGFCARSLTCKTHAMGAKRAVPGRSAPYDVLLQQYQKRNQAKIAASNALAAQRRENAQLSELAGGDADGANGNMNVVLDPDEETHLVLEGLSKNLPAPLERKVLVPTRNRHRFLYMREAYANAMIINGNTSSDALSSSGDLTLANQAISGSIGGLQGRCALVNVGTPPASNGTGSESSAATISNASVPGELYQVRAALKAILMTAQYNQQQQQQFQQRVFELQQQQLKQRQQQQQQRQNLQRPQIQQSQNAQLLQLLQPQTVLARSL